MAPKLTLILSGLLIVGILLGVTIVLSSQGGLPDPRHKLIAETVNVVVAGHACQLKHLSSGMAYLYPQSIVNIAQFMKGGQFQQSLWVFSENGKACVSMAIYGPANNTNAYLIEFGRMTFLEVKISSQLFRAGVTWQPSTLEGYALRDLNFG
jgi:hypothetical protein